MTPTLARPQYEADPGDPQRVKLAGDWTLASALTVADQLKSLPDAVNRLDATAINRIDSAGVLQLLRFADRRGLTFGPLGLNVDTEGSDTRIVINGVHLGPNGPVTGPTMPCARCASPAATPCTPKARC